MFGFKRKKKKQIAIPYVVKSTDNIISIAQQHDILWKELATFNNIEPPYILIPGETINIPGENNVAEIDEDEGGENVQQNENDSSVQEENDVCMQEQQVSSIKQGKQISKKKSSKREQKKSTSKVDVQGHEIKTNVQKQKIMYASPKSMLTKPASEPTTQAIDIDWMKEDEELYSEDVSIQAKKINIRFIIASVIIATVIGLLTWFIVMKFLYNEKPVAVSVDALISEQKSNTQNKKDSFNNNSESNAEKSQEEMVMKGGPDGSKNTEQDKKENNDKNTTQEKDDASKTSDSNNNATAIMPADITVQVLNAGSSAGAAGDVTKLFEQKDYKTSSAKNAHNDYTGVVIYYSAKNKDALSTVSAIVSDKYGTQKHEESAEVTKRYNADFVIVLGS